MRKTSKKHMYTKPPNKVTTVRHMFLDTSNKNQIIFWIKILFKNT